MDESHELPAFLEGLKPLCTELNSRWTRDFLLTRSAIHLDHLLSPSLAANSIQLESRAWNVLPSPKLPVGGDVDMTSSMLMTPVFTSERDTYGVGVLHAQCKTARGWVRNTAPGGGPFSVNVRFVVCPSRQSLTFMYDVPLDDSCLISVTRLRTLTDVSYYTYVFKQNDFRRESSREERGLRTDQITSCLRLMAEDQQKASCVVCGANWRVSCWCKMSLDRPQHPFDFAHFMKNILPFINTFEPVQKKVYYAFGSSQMWQCDGAHASQKLVNDMSVMNNLTAWSISEYLRNVKGIQKLVSGETSHEEHDFRGLHDAKQLDICSKETADDSGDASDVLLLETNIPCSVDNGDIIDDILMKTQEDERHDLLESSIANLLLEQPEVITSKSPSASVHETGFLSAPEIRPVDNHTPVSRNLQGPMVQKDKELQTVRPERPEPVHNEPVQVSSPGTQLDLLSKDERRQEKNREAARRSNEKRKIKLDSLKSDLKREREQLKGLRRRENELRKDNIVLRNQLKQAGN